MRPDFSVVIATDATEGVSNTLESYRAALDAMGKTYECLCVVDGRRHDMVAELQVLESDWPELTVIGQRPWGGEDAALASAVKRTSGDLVLLLPGWQAVEPNDLGSMFDALGDYDMVSAFRRGQPAGPWQGARNRVFRATLDRLFGFAPSDPFCRVHLIKRKPLEDICSFGVRQHFLPVIASQRGFGVTETELRPAETESATRGLGYVFKPLGHVRALFDAMTLYVVLKFLRRPLRFFGAIGMPIFLVGALITSALVLRRLFGDTGLADRPLLIFAVMMVVLGIQIIAIGLVGEIIIFAGSRKMKQYEVQEVIRGDQQISLEDGETVQHMVRSEVLAK